MTRVASDGWLPVGCWLSMRPVSRCVAEATHPVHRPAAGFAVEYPGPEFAFEIGFHFRSSSLWGAKTPIRPYASLGVRQSARASFRPSRAHYVSEHGGEEPVGPLLGELARISEDT